MYVLEIIPLSRTAPPDPLTYRSSIKISVGTIVDVPLRRKIVPGLVIAVSPAQEAKMMLKTASFSLSKSSSTEHGALPKAIVVVAEKIALYHATTVGAVLSALLIPVLTSPIPAFEKEKGSEFSVVYLEKLFVSRVAAYIKILDAAADAKDSKDMRTSAYARATLLVVPTITEAAQWAELLKKYKPIVLTSKVTGKRREEMVARACGARGLIITTPSFALLPITHLSTIIIERMSAGSYSLPKRPYIDVRYALTELARAREILLIYADYPLPVEFRENHTKPLSEAPHQYREGGNTTDVTLHDARTIPGAERKPWQAIPEAVRKEMKKTLSENGRVAVLAVRKGYSPAVICKDCGSAVTDEHGRALSLFISGAKRELRSSDGKSVESAEMFCKVCGSWNLMPLGIGIEQVEEELKILFPESVITHIDADSSSVKELARVKEEIAQPGAIIIGTEIMLSWLLPTNPVDLAVIASADSLLALPFWRARERFVRVGLMFAERSNKLIITTRKPEDEALDAIIAPTTSTFWKDEAGLRKMLSYPPFGTLIIFHSEGTETALVKLKEQILHACGEYTVTELPPQPISKTISKVSMVLQLPKDAWPNQELSERIANLSPAIRVHINSETFW
jgi:primosomal protein N'